jgi:hypothetical protein
MFTYQRFLITSIKLVRRFKTEQAAACIVTDYHLLKENIFSNQRVLPKNNFFQNARFLPKSDTETCISLAEEY